MNTSRKGLFVLGIVACLPLAACKDCGGGSSGGAPSATASASASAPATVASLSASASGSGSARPHRAAPIRVAGPGASLFRAVNSIELKDEQKAALEKLNTDQKEAEKAIREAADGGGPRAELKAALGIMATGVKAGKVEVAKLEPHQQAMEKASKARHERDAETTNKLYALLEPAQRTALVTSVKSSEEKRIARMKAFERPDAGGKPMSARRWERYVKDLSLDAEQQKKFEGILPKDDSAQTALRDETKKDLEAMLAAFDKDGFDAKKFQGDPKKRPRPLADQAKFFAGLTPILKPEQREKLAAKIEKQNDEGGHGGHGRHFDRSPDLPEEDDEAE